MDSHRVSAYFKSAKDICPPNIFATQLWLIKDAFSYCQGIGNVIAHGFEDLICIIIIVVVSQELSYRAFIWG